MRAKRRRYLILAAAAIALCVGVPSAAPPDVVRYQARLTDAAGVPLSGAVTLTFAIYGQENGGAALWSEVHTLSPEAGAVDLLLGETIPLASAVVNAPDRWLEISVDAGGGAKVLQPRQRLASVPFALVSDRLGDRTLAEVQADVAGSIATHAAGASAHHVKTTSASELTTGTLDPARIAPDSLTAAHVLDGPGSSLNADLLDNLHANELIDAAGQLVCVESWVGVTHNDGTSSSAFTCPGASVVLGVAVGCADSNNQVGSSGGVRKFTGTLGNVRFPSPNRVTWGQVMSTTCTGGVESVFVTCCM